jgi:tetratricopeptide (TPR) repeat protein
MSDAADIERVLRDLANAPGALARWRDGAECPSEHVLAAFAEGRLDAERAAGVRAHLARCGACVADARAALEELAAAAPVVSAPQGRGRLRPVASKALWIGLAAAAALLVFFGPFGPRDGGAGARRANAIELARVEALPARVPRGPRPDAGDEAELAFRDGLAAYAAGDYAAAEVALGYAVGLAPERADAALYRGSVLLLLERPEEAVPHLERARAAEGDAGREARWQLAQALLATGKVAEAVGELDALAGSGHRAADAAELRDRLRALGF